MADPSQDDPVINAESRQGVVWAICAVFTLTSFAAVALRVYTRVHILRRPGADDLVIVIAEVGQFVSGRRDGVTDSILPPCY